MNLNLLAYGIYFAIIAVIILKVGFICYNNGNQFVLHLIPEDEDFCLRLNNLLLAGYYLINVGYVIFTLSEWETVTNLSALIESVSYQSAIIIAILSILHYSNIILITLFLKKKSF